jgi:hypothetical protein
MIGALKTLSGAQWTFKPGPDRWSIAEIVEHVLFVLERVDGPVREKLAMDPETPVHPDYKLVDDIIIFQFPNRLSRFPSPMPPSGGVDQAQAADRLLATYARLAKCIETAAVLRNHSLPAAPLKLVSQGAYEMMDGYQWIIAAAAHTERHTKQVLEVIADPAFPM